MTIPPLGIKCVHRRTEIDPTVLAFFLLLHDEITLE
jgi:hypothetical protein